MLVDRFIDCMNQQLKNLVNFKNIITEKVSIVPDDELVLICTGSKEQNAALTKIFHGHNKHLII